MVRVFPRAPYTQTTRVTRRNHATGGAPQLWRNRAFAGTRLTALANLTALWHGTLGTSILTAWVAGTGWQPAWPGRSAGGLAGVSVACSSP